MQTVLPPFDECDELFETYTAADIARLYPSPFSSDAGSTDPIPRDE